MDTMIAMFVFLAALTIVMIIVSLDFTDNNKESVMNEAVMIPEIFFSETTSEASLLTDNELDLDKLTELSEMEYQELKDILHVKSDFCVFIEDMDGNVLNISELTNTNSDVGIGSSAVEVAPGIICAN